MTKNLKNIIVGFVGLILISFLIIKLNPKPEDSRWGFIKTMTLSELFEYAYLNQNSEYSETITKMIIDSIRDDSNNVISTIDIIDSVNNQMKLGFCIKIILLGEYSIKERIVFDIYINKTDSLLVKERIVNSKDSLKREMVKYISNPLNEFHLPMKYIKHIKYFDDYPVTNQLFYLNAQVIPDSLGKATTWTGLFNTLDLIIDAYQQLRNEISIKRFNKGFDELELDKQISIAEIYPINIYIFLDYRHIVSYPPPPPINSTNYFYEELEFDMNE